MVYKWFEIKTITLKLPLLLDEGFANLLKGCQKVGAPAHNFYLYKQMMNTIKIATEYNYGRCNIVAMFSSIITTWQKQTNCDNFHLEAFL